MHTLQYLIGLDGGASKVRGGMLDMAWPQLEIKDCRNQHEIVYSSLPGYHTSFRPVSLDLQLAEFRENRIHLREDEKLQGKAMVEAAALVIQKIAPPDASGKIIVGIGMPGLKTSDKKGIAVMANGPRIPEYASQLAEMLKNMGISLAHPIAELGSDADYCGIGETYSRDGKLKNVQNAYYLGVGTGIADAMTIQGKLLPFDQSKAWIAKSWEMVSSRGSTYEKSVAMPGIHRRYCEKTKAEAQADFHAGMVFEKALQGDTHAREVLEEVALDLAELIFDRIYTLGVGGTKSRFANPSRASLTTPDYQGVWNRIVIGQRLGHIWMNQTYYHAFQSIVCKALSRQILLLSESLCNFYLPDKKVRPDLLVPSGLDTAPILGAGISAYLVLRGM